MSSGDKFNLKSGRESHNYQAGRDINQNIGSIIQQIAQSRLAKIAAIMTIVAGIVAVAQYAGTLPANFKLRSASLRFNGVKYSFAMHNEGPDNIRNLEWYAWIEGWPRALNSLLHDKTSLVAKGDMYSVDHLGEGLPPDTINPKTLDQVKDVYLCLIYDGPLPGTKQWMLLHQKNGPRIGVSGNIYSDSGIYLRTIETGGGIIFFSKRCGSK